MTRVAIRGEEYAGAAETFAGGNRLAADLDQALQGALRCRAPMAGDDSTSVDFGRDYDEAATEAVGALGEVAGAFATLALLTDRSGANHGAADHRSVVGRAPDQRAASTADLDLDLGLVEVTPWAPPTSIGGDSGTEPDWWDLVIDHLQGFAWPNADTGELRHAARSWSDAATQLRLMPSWCETGARQLEAQRSPEVQLALDAATDLSTSLDDLALVCDDLATACRDHADDVERHRDLITSILRELAIEAGVSLALGAIAAFFTAGGGAAVGTAVAATRAAAAARRILTVLRALKASAQLRAATRLGPVAERVRPVRSLLRRFADARHVDDAADLRRVEELADDWRHLPRQLEYTWDAVVKYKKGGRMTPMEHIRLGHWPDSTLPGKGHFSEGVTEQLVKDYVEEAVRRGQVHPTQTGRVDCDLGRVVGIDVSGLPASSIRVHVHDGVVTSAYPVRPLEAVRQ